MKSRSAIAMYIAFASMASAVCLHEPQTLQQEFQSCECVVVADVVSKEAVWDDEGFISAHDYELRIATCLKGSNSVAMKIRDENDSGRFYMETGKQYLLFIRNTKSIDIDPCGHSGLLLEREDVLKAIKQYAEPSA